MSGNHLTDGVSIDKTSEKDEWNEVLVKNCWVEVEVGCDEGPGEEEWYQTQQCTARTIATLTARLDDVHSTVIGVSLGALGLQFVIITFEQC